MARDVSRARFRPVTCRALCWIGAASGRRKSEEPPLLLPIVRQIPGEHDEPRRRQLDGWRPLGSAKSESFIPYNFNAGH